MYKETNEFTSKKQKLIVTIFLPYILSLLFQATPVVSYLIAWVGSLFIFYCSMLSPIGLLPKQEALVKWVMQPAFLLQGVFAGFMCCTSIFYFLNHVGYQFLTDINGNNFVVNQATYEIANCQRYYVLAHACLVVGLTVAHKRYVEIAYTFNKNTDELLISICIAALTISFLLGKFPALLQFSLMMRSVAEFSGTLAFVKGIHGRNLKLILFGGGLFTVNLLLGSLTGYKEVVIIQVILLLCLLLPYYKRLVYVLSLPAFAALFYVLPTLATTIRAQVWTGDATSAQARTEVYKTLSSPDPFGEIRQNNWDFLTERFSEIGMFTQYVNYVPFHHDYYAFEILQNSMIALVPRVIWERKPDTESISMQRVYESGVVNRLSDVSAKTRPIVDGYLSGGTIGVCIVMVVYGLVAQTICNQAEKYFGGYEVGCIVVFNGIFQQLWRGNNLEFLINNIFYGYILMFLLFHLLRMLNILGPTRNEGLCN